MLTYAVNGRTFILRGPASEEHAIVRTLLEAGHTVTVRSSRFRRWAQIEVLDARHLDTLAACERAGDRAGWHSEPVREEVVEAPRPTTTGWHSDGHPAEERVREELRALGAVPVGRRRLPAGVKTLVGPGETTRGREGRMQRYWQRFMIPSGNGAA